MTTLASDAGRAKQAVRFADMLGADFALMHKTRHSATVVEVTEVTRNGEVVRTARFMQTRVIAVVEHPADDGEAPVQQALLEL